MKKILLAAALVASCGVASAQGYAGALIGMANVNATCGGCDTSDTGFKLYGGYEVMPNLAVEVAYTDFGKYADLVNLKPTALSVVAAYHFPLSGDLSGVGRLGLASVKSKWTGGSSSDIKLYAGLGLDYNLTPSFKLTGAFDFTQAELAGDSGSVYIFGVGAQMGF
jgi:OmpA-OmpF porin, OOP family